MAKKPAEKTAGSQVGQAPDSGACLSSGITLVNLAVAGSTDVAFKKGHIYRVIGNSGSGKTFMSRGILAEACLNKDFDGYELVYDDVERGALMDTAKFFGTKLVERLVPPGRTKDKEPLYSRTVGDFLRRINSKLDAGKKIIWICDSLDSLNPDTDVTGKMSDGKAKVFSQEIRRLIQPLEQTGSILILISQTRVSMGGMFKTEVTAGGMAPEFYATTEIWLHKGKTMKVVFQGKKYTEGLRISARVKKNRLTGQDCTVVFPFHPSYGIDDIGACVDYLVQTGHWKKEKGISATEFEFSGTRTKLIQKVEDDNLQKQLRQITGQVWQQIRDACTPVRQPRY